MFAAILSFASGLLGKFLGSLFAPKDPTPVDLADSNARAQTDLAQTEAANDVVSDAAAVRTAADARVLRESDQPPGAVGAPTGLDDDPAGHWRD